MAVLDELQKHTEMAWVKRHFNNDWQIRVGSVNWVLCAAAGREVVICTCNIQLLTFGMLLSQGGIQSFG